MNRFDVEAFMKAQAESMGVNDINEVDINSRTQAMAYALMVQSIKNDASTDIYGAGMFQLAVGMCIRSPEWARAYNEQLTQNYDDPPELTEMEQLAFEMLAVKVEHGYED